MSIPIFACRSKGYGVIPLLKVASSSIVQTMVKGKPPAKKYNIEDCGGLFLFSFVRDPRDRLFSVWRNLVHSPPNGELLLKGEGMESGMGLDEFVSAISPELMRNLHMTPQSALLDSLYPSYVGRFESLNRGWALMRIKFPTIPTLKWLNPSQPSESWREAYSTESIRKVESLYRRDMDDFGYGE